MVTDDTKALQCDRCMSNEIWKCAECLNLTGEMYDHLYLTVALSYAGSAVAVKKLLSVQTTELASKMRK